MMGIIHTLLYSALVYIVLVMIVRLEFKKDFKKIEDRFDELEEKLKQLK